MKIKKLTIKNYRCYSRTSINLGRQSTVLIGKNGVGKSTVLSAIKTGVSFVFSKKPDTFTAGSDYLNVVSIDSDDSYIDPSTYNPSYPISVALEADYANMNLSWTMQKDSSKGRLLPKHYKVAFEDFHNKVSEGNQLPLLVHYSDRYPHIDAQISKESQKAIDSAQTGIATNFGYYQWDAEAACNKVWEILYLKAYDRLIYLKEEMSKLKSLPEEMLKKSGDRMLDVQDEIDSLQINLDTVKQCILNFFLPLEDQDEEVYIYDIELPIKAGATSSLERSMQFVYSDGRRVYLNHLPAGYQRLVFIVMDIAYRLQILNPHCSDITECSGLAMIDEVDLHLHPSLQRTVLNRFLRTFPNIQFVVTTHSPLVLANYQVTDDNKLIKLSYVKSDGQYHIDEMRSTYGLDYNSTLKYGMEVLEQDRKVTRLLNAIRRYKERNDSERMESALLHLRELVGEEQENYYKKELEL